MSEVRPSYGAELLARIRTLRIRTLLQPPGRYWLATVARLVLGGVFIAAGAVKVGDLSASGRAVAAYRLLPFDVAMFVGTVQPFVEIALGVLLVVGLGTRLAAVISGLMLIAFTIGIVSAWIRGLRIDCGCFSRGGDLAAGERTQYLSATIRDIALLFAAGFLALFPRSRLSLDDKLLDGGRT